MVGALIGDDLVMGATDLPAAIVDVVVTFAT
jgi:hypothetical protein